MRLLADGASRQLSHSIKRSFSFIVQRRLRFDIIKRMKKEWCVHVHIQGGAIDRCIFDELPQRCSAQQRTPVCVCVCCCSMHRSLQWMASGFIARENRWRKEEYGHRSSPCHRLISGLSSPPYHMLCNWIGLLSLSLIWSDAMQCAQPLFPSHDYIDCILPLWDDYTKNELIAFCSQNAL